MTKLEDIRAYVKSHVGVDILKKDKSQDHVRGRYLFYQIAKDQKIMMPVIYKYLNLEITSLKYYDKKYNQGVYKEENNLIIEMYGK